jgi:hypothetical protein
MTAIGYRSMSANSVLAKVGLSYARNLSPSAFIGFHEAGDGRSRRIPFGAASLLPATYTEIYARISASLDRGAIVTVCGRTSAPPRWFAVVTLGLGAHLWPLLEGVR